MNNNSTSKQNSPNPPVRQFFIDIYDTLFPTDTLLNEKQQFLRRYLFSFFVPCILMMMVYCSIGTWPFKGPNSPLVLDMNGQYVYFFANLRNIILGDNSLLYSWTRSLGGEFLGMYAYYLASPVSWLVLLFPADRITEAIWLMLMLKTGICGLTMSIFLDKLYPTKTLNTVLFSTLYAFCAYNLAYMSNIMWMDGVMLLPLLLLGLEQLLSRRKYKLYTISLTLVILSNYYIGFMICIFVVIYFIYYHILHEKSEEGHYYLKSFVRVGVFSIISVAMSAVIILPAYYSLSFGKIDYDHVTHVHMSIQNLTDVITKLFYGHFDTIRPNGSPFVYCGMLSLLALPLFFVSNKIKTREKAGAVFVLTVLVISMAIPQIDVLWHGGQAPNWMNFRYSFIFSFMLLVFAYRGFAVVNHISMKVLTLVGGILVICSKIISVMNYEERYGYVKTFNWNYSHFIFITNTCIIIILLAVIYRYRKVISDADTPNGTAKKRGPVICLAVCVLAEAYTAGVLQNTALAMDVGYASRASYVDFLHNTQPVVDYIYNQDSSFYRTEKTFFRTANDNMALNMRGISGSTSTMNMKTLNFLKQLGYSSSSYISWYSGGNPVSDSLLGIKYIIGNSDGGGSQLFTELYNLIYEDEENDRYVFENPYSLGIAYAANTNILQVDPNRYKNPFDFLNAVLSSIMSGQEHKVFCPIEATLADDTYESQYPVAAETECEHEHCHHAEVHPPSTYIGYGNGKPVYMYLPLYTSDVIDVYLNGERIDCYIPLDCSSSITLFGQFAEGEKYEITLFSEYGELIQNGVQNYFYTLDMSEFQRVTETLQMNQMHIASDSSEDRITGHVTVTEEFPILFTSIPYDKNWRIYADGEEVLPYLIETDDKTLSPVLDAVIAVELSPGEHDIVFEYRSDEFMLGAAISLSGLMAFFVIICCERLKKKKKQSPLRKRVSRGTLQE